jgi:hypothetical protein
VTPEEQIDAVECALAGYSLAYVREICRERIKDNVFCMVTGSGTTGWIRRTFWGLQDIAPELVATIYEQECEKYGAEADPEVWRIYTTGTDAEVEALQERTEAEMHKDDEERYDVCRWAYARKFYGVAA